MTVGVALNLSNPLLLHLLNREDGLRLIDLSGWRYYLDRDLYLIVLPFRLLSVCFDWLLLPHLLSPSRLFTTYYSPAYLRALDLVLTLISLWGSVNSESHSSIY